MLFHCYSNTSAASTSRDHRGEGGYVCGQGVKELSVGTKTNNSHLNCVDSNTSNIFKYCVRYVAKL